MDLKVISYRSEWFWSQVHNPKHAQVVVIWMKTVEIGVKVTPNGPQRVYHICTNFWGMWGMWMSRMSQIQHYCDYNFKDHQVSCSQVKFLPKKFQERKFRRWPVDQENLENCIPQKFVCIQYTLLYGPC